MIDPSIIENVNLSNENSTYPVMKSINLEKHQNIKIKYLIFDMINFVRK